MFEFSVFLIISYCHQTVLAQCRKCFLCIFFHLRLTYPIFFTYFTQNTVTSRAKVYVLQYCTKHKILHTFKTTYISSLFGARDRNYEVAGLKMRRMLFRQFIHGTQISPPPPPQPDPENFGCLEFSFGPTLDLKQFCSVGSRHLLKGAFTELWKVAWRTLKYFHKILYLNIFWNSENKKKMWHV